MKEYNIVPSHAEGRFGIVPEGHSDAFIKRLDNGDIGGVKVDVQKPTNCSDLWGEEPEAPIAKRSSQYPDSNPTNYVVADVCIHPADFLRLQFAVWSRNNVVTLDQFMEAPLEKVKEYPEYMTDMVNSILSNNSTLPTPWIGVDSKTVPIKQEGRHRSISAILADYNPMKARIVSLGEWDVDSPRYDPATDIPRKQEIVNFVQEKISPHVTSP